MFLATLTGARFRAIISGMGRIGFWLAIAALGVLIWAIATDRIRPIAQYIRGESEQVVPMRE